ncbi:MAG: hypothetical protein ACK5TH_26825 [Prosthecobacter sp.]
MNFEQTLQAMVAAASKAAKGQWKAMNEYAEAEFRLLAASAMRLEASFVTDMAEAALQTNAKKRAKMEKIAKERTKLALENLELAAATVVNMSKADVKMAAQDAANAAVKVLLTAVNASLGVPLL